MLLTAEDKARLDPYMPSGLIPSADAGASERVQGAVKRMLLDQQIHPGQKVPMDLVAQRLGISRTPVREALRLLEGEGLVRALPNRGFTVRVTTVAETAHLFDARLCIERFTAEAAFERRTDAFLRELRAIQRTYRRVLKGAMNRRLGMVADKAFHVRISTQAENPVLVDVQKTLFDRIIFTRVLDGFPLARSDAAIMEHERIIAALQASSRERVVEAVAANVINGRDAITAYLQEQELVRRSV